MDKSVQILVNSIVLRMTSVIALSEVKLRVVKTHMGYAATFYDKSNNPLFETR